MAYQAKPKVEEAAIDGFLDRVEPPQRQAESRRLVENFGGATGFAPREADLSLYVLSGSGDDTRLLARLGKHRAGKSCLCVRHLDAINEEALHALIAAGLADLKRHSPVFPD